MGLYSGTCRPGLCGAREGGEDRGEGGKSVIGAGGGSGGGESGRGLRVGSILRQMPLGR